MIKKKSTINFASLEVDEIHYITSKLPFQVLELDVGLKYLGFQLNPNDYKKTNWMSLIAKLEKRLKVWSHKWLSRAGRLVLIKSVLEAIPVYWMSLSWIPKCILEKSRKICFSYLWRGNKEKKVMSWVRWERIVVLNALGG
jgi:hypothetical protein